MRLQTLFTMLALIALAALVFIVVRSLSTPKVAAVNPNAAHAAPAAAHGSQIYVAHTDLRVGTFVKDADLEPRDWPDAGIDPNNVRADQVPTSEFAGSVVREHIGKGEPIFRDKLVKPGDRGFLSAVLLPGMRAMTISVDSVSAHSGLLLAGDRVDVILTQTVSSSNETAAGHVSQTILRAARVLAVGTQLNPPQKADNIDDHPRTVTLEVTPKQAQLLAIAAQSGPLTLALRSLPATDDDTAEDEQATTKADLTKPNMPTWGSELSGAGPASHITVMRGTAKGAH